MRPILVHRSPTRTGTRGYVAPMTTIQRLTDSCVLVTTDDHATLFDPGFHTWGEHDLGSIPDVTRVLITHAHFDHVHPDFVRWLLDRRADLTIHANEEVAALLAETGIEASTDVPAGVAHEDVLHEPIPTGAQPPNRAFTVAGVFTHPGDSQAISASAPVLALPLIAPWTSVTSAVAFATRLAPTQVVPIHDFFTSASGRQILVRLASGVLAEAGIELVPLDWGESATV